MAIYWVTEVIPLAMTAMIPAVLFPMLGIMKSSAVSRLCPACLVFTGIEDN